MASETTAAMSVQQPPCDRHTIERFLADQLSGAEQSAFEDHLGTCTTCRECLDGLAAEESWWTEARGYLRSPPPDGSTPADDAGDDRPSAAGLLGLLTPCDDPRLIGTLGGYGIVGVVGCGGMGVVLKAMDEPLNRYVAVKVLSPQLAASGSARQRFAREAKAAAAVVHENVVAIHAVAEANGLPYFVMPYVSGPSLETRLRQTGPLAVVEVLRIGMQIASGLAAAHAQGLVHRDIKPANILLEEGVERVRITDFGLARAVDDASLTRSGVIAGTPQYMSPEQASGDPVDHRSDLFSLGSVLYALCTGRPPFRAETMMAVLRRVEESRPRPIREINPDVPEWLVRLIAKLQARDPADRFQFAAEVAALLEGYLAHRRQPATVPAPELPPGPPDEVKAFDQAVAPASPLRPAVAAAAIAAFSLAVALWLAGVGATEPSDSSAPTVVEQDFRNGNPLRDGLRLMGSDAEQVTVRELEGYRITLPATRKVSRVLRGVGVASDLRLAGDFQITAGYDLLAAGPAADLAGVDLFFKRAGDGNRHGRIGRFNTAAGAVYEVSDSTSRPTPGDVLRVPAQATRGQLRLARQGRTLAYSVKDETTGGEFKELYRADLGVEPLAFVLFEVNPGTGATPVDARLTELRIEDGTAIATEASRASAAEARGGGWWPWLVVPGVGFVLAFAGTWRFVGRSASTARARSPAADNRRVDRLLVPAGVASLASLGLGGYLLLTPDAPTSARTPVAEEFSQDFRGEGPLGEAFKPQGADGGTLVRDAEGLRIGLIGKSKNGAGVDLPRRFAGDCEITVAYELLKAERPAAGHGVGFVLRVETATPRPSDFCFFRMTRVQEGDVYWVSRTTTRDDGKPNYEAPNSVPTTARAGSLRIVRTGDEASFWVADDASGQFRKLCQRYVGAEDVTSIRLGAFSGWEALPVEVRVKDVRVRAGGGGPRARSAGAGPSLARAGWLAGLVAASVAAAAFAGWLVIGPGRRRRAPAAWAAAVLTVTLVAGLLLGPAAAPDPAAGAAPPDDWTELAQDYRGGRSVGAPFQLTGPDPAAVVREEPGGLRLSLPAGRKQGGPVGVALGPIVRGDFDVSCGYELLDWQRPETSWRGVELYVATESASQAAVVLQRTLPATDADYYLCSHNLNIDGKRQHFHRPQAVNGSPVAGRLRLTRTGREIVLWAAEDGAEYRELRRFDFGPDKVKQVRFAAHPSPAQNAVDVRLTDVKVRYRPAAADTLADLPRGPGWGWLAIAETVGLVVALACVGGWAVHRRRLDGTPAAEVSADGPTTLIAFACPACAKPLKVKAALAGRKGKCPHCGGAVTVPAAVGRERPHDTSEAAP